MATTVFAVAGLTPTAAPAATGTALEAFDNGFSGGGFVNVVAVDPTNPNVLVAGGDVSGLHRSTNAGVSWDPVNTGLWNLNQFHVADVSFSKEVPGRVYAAVGFRGAPGGGLLVSNDSGKSWDLLSDEVQFSGANNAGIGPLPGTHPRSTGDLLVIDDTARVITAATFDGGVMRSRDGGATWTALGLQGRYLRAAVADPGNPGSVLVAVYGSGLYRADASGSVTPLPSSPQGTEELAVVGPYLFAAAGTDGVYRSSDRGGTWQQVVPASGAGGPAWISVAGGVDSSGRQVVYVGCDSPDQVRPGAFTSVLGSIDGGNSWSSLTQDPSRIDPGGWWLAESQPWMKLGQGSYTAAQLVTAAGDPRRVYVSGRSGVWRSLDGGASWEATVDGLGVTINRDVVVDPTTPKRVYVANTDWVFLGSDDGLKTVRQVRPPSSTTGFALGLDATSTPAAVVLGTGDRDTNSGGDVFTSTDPLGGTQWVDEGLSAVTGGRVPVAVAMNHVGGSRVLLAAVEGSGIWRKVGSTWTRSSNAGSSSIAANSAAFSWRAGSSEAYLYEPDTGLWGSSDAGETWRLIRALVSDIPMTGHLVADPAVPGRLYLSVSSGIFRVDGASGAAASFTDLGIERPGPVTIDSDGTLFASSRSSKGTAARLLRSDDAGANWSEVGGTAYAAGGGQAFALAAGGGSVFAALNGNGILSLGDGTQHPPPPPPPPPTTTKPPTTTPPADIDGDGYSDGWDLMPNTSFSAVLDVWAGAIEAGNVRVALASLEFFDYSLRSVQVNTPDRSCIIMIDQNWKVASATNGATIEGKALCLSGITFGPEDFRLSIRDTGVGTDKVHLQIGDGPELYLSASAGDVQVLAQN